MVYTRETTEMKKIINNPNAVVEEMLQGIEIANPDVLYDGRRRHCPQGKK